MEVDNLSMDNILGQEEIESLFTQDSPEEDPKDQVKDNEDPKEDNKDENKEETTEVNPDELFDLPESVGSGKEDKKGSEDTPSDKDGPSPNKIYSSIAKAFAEEGIFPDLDDETITSVKTPEDLRNLVEEQIRAGLDERQKRIDEALNSGVEPDVVRQYEGTLQYLNNITEDAINAEDENGEKLRKQLIYQDFINKGFTKQRASKEVQRSFDNGTDIEDAKDALQDNKTFFKDQYDELIEKYKKEEAAEVEKNKKQAEELKNSILSDKKVFGDLDIDNNTRRRIYDNISKPVYKDPDTGEYYTALQKYESENRTEFLKNVGLVFTLTDGFKNFNGLIKNKVRKETRKGLKELEHTLNNTSIASDGSLKYVGGDETDPNSFIGKGWKLDI